MQHVKSGDEFCGINLLILTNLCICLTESFVRESKFVVPSVVLFKQLCCSKRQQPRPRSFTILSCQSFVTSHVSKLSVVTTFERQRSGISHFRKFYKFSEIQLVFPLTCCNLTRHSLNVAFIS